MNGIATQRVAQERARREEDERKFVHFRDDPHYAVCSAGGKGWFWIVWPDYEAACNDQPTATGYLPSKAAAIAAAVAVAGPNAGTYPTAIAAAYRRHEAVQARLARGAERTTAPPSLFVYQYSYWWPDWDVGPDYSPHHFTAHRVLRLTERWYFVDTEPYREGQQQRPEGVRTMRLDRREMEATGHTRHRRQWYGDYYLKPELPFTPRATPACLTTLGLDGDATEADVRRAYRRLAQTAHPDAGGDAAQFVALQRAYEAALRHVADGGA